MQSQHETAGPAGGTGRAAGRHASSGDNRPGVVLLLTAILLVTMFGFVAFSVDYGYMSIVHGNLQNAADAAALASVVELGDGEDEAVLVAGSLAASNPIGSYSPTLEPTRTQAGIYNVDTRTFTPTTVGPNAMRVVTELNQIPLFFAPVFGRDHFSGSAEAIAMTKPREIVLVVDLSGSMNDDSDVCSAPEKFRDNASSLGLSDPQIGFRMAEQLYLDLNFGAFPGAVEHVGKGLVAERSYSYGLMTYDSGPLRYHSNARYKIDRNDNESKRKQQAYRWIIDNQLARLMPNARPYPDSTNSDSYDYWEKYLDFIMKPYRWNRAYGTRQRKSYGRVWLPPSQDSDQIYYSSWDNKVGYRTYAQFLVDYGRDRAPIHSNSVNASPSKLPKTELSAASPLVRKHAEDVNGTSFNFPPRTYPMHACRRSLIRAIQLVKKKNDGISASVADRVSVVTFDGLTSYHAPELLVPLTTDYDAAMLACTDLQAVGDMMYSTASQPGLSLAAKQLKTTNEGGPSRPNSTRVLIFMTDGRPNLYDTPDSEISDYISDNPDEDFYSGNSYWDRTKNAALIQAASGNRNNALVFSIGMGIGSDHDFMDRMSRLGGTDKAGGSPRTSGDPAEYEESITKTLEDIIRYAGVSLVR